jgi:Fem-1 family protein b
VIEEDGQICSPLIVAAKHGHDKVVKMLLSKFKPDMEQEGTVKFDGYVIEGASALWCAAGKWCGLEKLFVAHEITKQTVLKNIHLISMIFQNFNS